VLIAFILLTMPLAIAWRADVITTCWAWFIVPVFALPPLTPLTAIGLSIAVAALSKTPLFDALEKTKNRHRMP
jgi:hypothetical protein